MATAQKANPKVVPIAEGSAEADAGAPKKSKKKLFLLLGIALLLLGGGAGAAWYFMGSKSESAAEAHKAEPPKPPVFVNMDPFTVNLQHENGDQYLQVAFTLQVADEAQVELLKLYTPLVRSRILLLLSTKKPSELATEEGKKKLQDEIIAKVKQPFTPQSPPQAVTGVFFTSFVIQ
ncbi:MAG TPA: flagellar basal body-associated protein FliL [Noviherbaspirillum sp.]|uniref:flagellar basal body-associated protein FliL n=1 Tax=Noviherbaspirillum sp. TaxID=1926288 RepID=UPI002B4788A8|nr:flagellar basal body-associated protein FliL [Noviherbaspirillum sp.]HJV88497.1 flagellar basal body-associated protein FliL [Noviherbaspirillum sp.]